MIEPVLVRRLSLITLVLAGAVSAAAFASGSPRIAGGIAAGAGLGLLPAVSWSALGGMLFAARSPFLFGLISLGKLLVYAAALFFLVGRNLVDPLAFAGALIAPTLILGVISLRRGAAL